MTTATRVLRSLQARASNTGLPREFYTDPGVAQFLDGYRDRLLARLEPEQRVTCAS
jgi:hypothetical protein